MSLTLNSWWAGPQCCPEIIFYVPLPSTFLFFLKAFTAFPFSSNPSPLELPGELASCFFEQTEASRGAHPSVPTSCTPIPLAYLPECSPFSPVTVSDGQPLPGAGSHSPSPPKQLSQGFPFSTEPGIVRSKIRQGPWLHRVYWGCIEWQPWIK